jgi:hypothetical protein
MGGGGTKYRNGQIPRDMLRVVKTGHDVNGYFEWLSTPATWARWEEAVAYSIKKWGRAPRIRSGWNIYRPLGIQKDARSRACAMGNCNGAASAGYSSHGGNWNGRDCLAIDVDPNGLSWRQVDEAMVHAGFAAGLITEKISGMKGGEPWHYIDFNAFGPVPAFAGTPVTPVAPVKTKEWDEMATEAEYQSAVQQGVAAALAGSEILGRRDVITVQVPDGDQGEWWSLNLADNTKARLWAGTQLEFRRNLGIREYPNQDPEILKGMVDLSVYPA